MNVLQDNVSINDISRSDAGHNASDASIISHNDLKIVDAYEFLHQNEVEFVVAPPIDIKKARKIDYYDIRRRDIPSIEKYKTNNERR